MLEYFSYAIFIVTVGLAAFGIMLSTYMRKRYPGVIVSSLIYYQVFVFAFGFYGLWGQAIFRLYIGELLNTDIRERIETVASLQGFPFMMLSWYMLIRFAREITSLKTGTWFNTVYIVISVAIFGSLIYIISRPDADPNYYYYLYYSILCTVLQLYAAFVLLIFKPANKRLKRRKMVYLSVLLAISSFVQVALINLTDVTGYAALGFILAFFTGHAGIAVTTKYTNLLKPLEIRQEFNGTFETFCKNHEISPRESEIVKEICRGLTNKEISESLFISVQTVKDHTHRIYIKTGARNRVDLINRLKEII